MLRSPRSVSAMGLVRGAKAQSRSAALEPGEAVEDEVECELKLGVVVAPAEGAAVGDREGHLHDVGMAGAECAGEGGGRLRLEVAGIVEEGLREPEKAAAEDVQGVMRLC